MGLCSSKSCKSNTAPPTVTKKKRKKRKSTPEERYAAYKVPKEFLHDNGATVTELPTLDGESASSPRLLDPFETTDATSSSTTTGGEHQGLIMATSSTPTTLGSSSLQQQPSISSPYYYDWNTTNALVPIATARKGRALQSRLEKAKQMQLVLSSNSSSSNTGDSGTMDGSNSQQLVPWRGSTKPSHGKNHHHLHRTITLESPASAVALAPNGTTVYVGTDNGRLLVFYNGNNDSNSTTTAPRSVDLSSIPRSGNSVTTSNSNSSTSANHTIRDICILPDTDTIAVAVDDYCRIVNATTLEILHSIRHDDRVYALTMVAQHFLCVAGFSSTVNIYNATTYEYERHLERPAGLILAMDASADWLAIAGSDKTCAVIQTSMTPTTTTTTTNNNTTNQKQQQWGLAYEIKRNTTILAVSWCSTKHLAIASKDNIGVFMERTLLYELEVHGTTSLAWSPSGRYLCVVAPQRSALYSGSTLRHSFSSSSSSSLSNNDDESYFVVCAWGQFGTLALAGDTCLQILRAGETTVDDASSTASYFSNRGEWVLKEDAFADLDAKAPAVAIQSAVEKNIVALAFSKGSKFRPSSYLAVSCGDSNLVVVRNGTDYSLVAELEFPATVSCMTFSYGSRYLALGCHDAHVYIYDTTADWELVTKIEFSDPIAALCFTVRNERLFVGSIDGTVAYLNVEKEFDFEDELEGNESGVTSLDCSAKHFAAGRDEGIVSVFEIDKLEDPVADLHRDSPVTSICFGVNSRFLAVGDAEGLVGVYSAKGGWVLSHQIEMDNSICMVRWCAQGRHLAVSDVAGSIKIFDTIFWQEIGAAQQPRASTGSKYLDFSQDGKYLAFGSDRVIVLETANDWEPVLGTSDKDDK